uniref:Beta-glucosidase n=1 Tax=Opuntia streptacantha TaxID=393608 RepID=A0A7C9B020_OPUST
MDPKLKGRTALMQIQQQILFLATHIMILCHAHVVQLYKQQYQATQNGKIGIPLVTKWFKPLTESREDVEAAGRAFDFLVGWILEPLVYGDYPFTMKSLIRNGLPTFSDEEKSLVQNSFDFIGCNYYTSRYASSIPFNPNETPTDPDQFQSVNLTVYNLSKQPIGEKASGSDEIYLFPEGLKDLLLYIKKHYKDPTLYVTENGYPEKRDDSIPLEVALQDDSRIRQILTHLNAVKQAISEGAKVKGYLMWTLMDCMEFESGYQVRYGLNYTDYLSNLDRIPKKSAKWFHSWLNEHRQTQITTESLDAPHKAGRILSSLSTCFKSCTT